MTKRNLNEIQRVIDSIKGDFFSIEFIKKSTVQAGISARTLTGLHISNRTARPVPTVYGVR